MHLLTRDCPAASSASDPHNFSLFTVTTFISSGLVIYTDEVQQPDVCTLDDSLSPENNWTCISL